MKGDVVYVADVSVEDREIFYVKGNKLFDQDMKQVGVLRKAVATPREKKC